MEKAIKINKIAIESFRNQSSAIAMMGERLNEDFDQAVAHIHQNQGRVVVTGIGKSAIIGSKIVATLNSTGTPALFMHAADAIHGDLGMVQQNDTVVCLSKSGNTPEIKALVPLLKNSDNKLIAITGDPSSYLGQQADYVLNSYVPQEACPNNLAPTTSTTAQLVMGDALAIALLSLNNFNAQDFAKYHPGGSLGKKLYLKVEQLLNPNLKPVVNPKSPLKSVIIEISRNRLGATAVIENDQIVGIITDGDIRRLLESDQDIRSICAENIMNKKPKTIEQDVLANTALERMKSHSISQLIVTHQGQYAGIVHLHEIIKEGIV